MEQRQRNKKTQQYLHHLAYTSPAGEFADALQNQIERMIDRGASRDALYEDLKFLALSLRDEGREDLEDEALEVMDVLSGWCAPSARI